MLRFLPLLLAFAVPAASLAAPDGDGGDGQAGGFFIHQHIVIRLSRAAPPPPPDVQIVREKRGPKCIKADGFVGAARAPDGLDLTNVDGHRWRITLDDACPGLLFYTGVYLRPPRDRKLCAGRDMIYSRAGAACPILGFARLIPAR